MKKYLLLAAVSLVLSLPASASYAATQGNGAEKGKGIEKNGNNGHHRCGGNSGQGIGNYCKVYESKREYFQPFKKKSLSLMKKGSEHNCGDKGVQPRTGVDKYKVKRERERTGLDNGKGNGGYNYGHGNEGRGNNGLHKGRKSDKEI